MKRKNIVFKALTCGLATLAFTACTDTWESHYTPKAELNATETLWDLIQADDELSQFEELVKATGYDNLLNQNRFYTVWAPVNGSDIYTQYDDLTTLNDSMKEVLKFEFIENHVADYNHTASGVMTEDNLVKMLNGKYNRFEGSTDAYTFKKVAVTEANIAAKNGLLHKTENNAVFTANVWEQLAKESSLSLLNSFLKSYDEVIFDAANSVQGPMVNGKVTYLDSVVIENNEWFSRIGQLNREDSSWTMFAPTNQAWLEAYDKAKNYFVYPETEPKRDSLQRVMAESFLCHHLVFSNNINKGKEQDSLTSICRTDYAGYDKEVFKGAELERLYDNLVESKELSNGTLNIVDSYNYRPFWHDTIRIQGETLLGEAEGLEGDAREYKGAYKTYASISKDSVNKYRQTSNGSIGVYTNSSPTGNPTLTYTIKNTLSAKYRIRVVLVPKQFIDWKDTLDIKPNYVSASIYYKELTGKKSKKIELLKKYETNPYKVDTLILNPKDAEYIEFPVNEFNLDASETTVAQLEIKGEVSSRDSKYDRVLRVEQVFLEPVIEE